MADDFSFDVSDVLKLSAQLGDVEKELPKGTLGAMRGAAHTGKEAWQKGLEATAVPAAASTIWYRFFGNGLRIAAQIENSKGTPRLQGYTHAQEFGSPTVSPTRPAAAAVPAAAEDLAKGLAIAGENALKRALES